MLLLPNWILLAKPVAAVGNRKRSVSIGDQLDVRNLLALLTDVGDKLLLAVEALLTAFGDQFRLPEIQPRHFPQQLDCRRSSFLVPLCSHAQDRNSRMQSIHLGGRTAREAEIVWAELIRHTLAVVSDQVRVHRANQVGGTEQVVRMIPSKISKIHESEFTITQHG